MTTQRGFIVLTSVIIIGAVVLLIGMGVVMRSIGETDMSQNEELSTRALTFANSCAELAVIKLRNNFNYSGNEDIIVNGSDSCHVFPTEGSGNLNRVVKTDGAIRGYKRRVLVEINQLDPLIVGSWRDVPSF